MFSWICARCGRDNPPSATTCVNCGARFDDPVEPDAVSEIPAANPVVNPALNPVLNPGVSVSVAAPPMPKSARPTLPGQAARGGVPTLLLTILSFLAIVGIGFGIYYGITWWNGRKQATSTGLDPAANVARTKVTNPIQKYVEVVGIRLTEGPKKKPEARFVVVNHSQNSFDNLSATVTVYASTQRSDEDSAGTFRFKLESLGPYESRDMSVPFDTKLKPYEFPDWQNVNPDVEITSP
ncbi:zinc finger Ran-binding domain-containing protein [Nevskia soli]|jgi:hypothetical protein|uniref:zinc finger Ran-binding domain-containing protein n=1 Tax=Nevskia soli TaxID=418856 RepID=UPI0015D93045|nr:zinc finger Ran-binding domain-containing protein [Nevskia soli]